MKNRTWRVGILAIITSAGVAGCLPDAESALDPAPAPAEETPNSAPTISGAPGLSATAGAAWQFVPVAADKDGDELTFSAAGLPSWITLNPTTGRLWGTPVEADVGTTAAIVLSVSDGEATASLAPFSITVASGVQTPPPQEPPPPSNTAPHISGSPTLSVQATTAYVFVPVATDSETPQSLSFSIVNKPAWASFSTTTGRLSGTPTASQAGVYRDIIIRVSDGSLSASLPAFSITVTAAPNRAPTISGSPATVVTAGTAYSFRPSASDPDGQTLSYTISNKPAWATFSSTSGRLSGTPGNGHVGTTSGIVITVSDGMFTASLPPFSVTVNAPSNRAPTVSGTPSTAVTLGNAYRFAPSATDPDGDSLVWSIAGKPTGATFSTTTGELTWTPSSTGAWTNIVITVTDAKGASTSLPAFSIVVNAPVKAPSATLLWLPPTEFTDGSALPGTGISGYRVYHGTSIATLRAVAEVDERTTNFTVPDLARGTHYFAVTAVSAAGLESALSAVGSKTVQ